MANTSPDWSTLPEHILFFIAQRLPSRMDTLRFRAVCRTFRSSLPAPPPPNPLSNHHYYYNIDHPGSNYPLHFVVTEYVVYAFEPISQVSNTHQTQPIWLIKVDESNSGKVRLQDPFSTRRSNHISKMLPKSLNLLDYRVHELSKGYRIDLAKDDPREFNGWEYVLFEKVVVATDDDLAVMALINLKLVVWRSGSETNKWVEIDFDYGSQCVIEDIIYHKKRFYVVMSNGCTVTVDPKSLKINETVPPLPSDLRYKRLVKSPTDLFLVEKYWLDYDYANKNRSSVNNAGRFCMSRFKIFKLDEEKHEWIHVEDGWEDRALFMCNECNFFVSAKDLPGCKWNCVYLSEKGFLELESDYPGRDAAIFNLKDDATNWLESFQGYSEIFWPPPSWLLPER